MSFHKSLDWFRGKRVEACSNEGVRFRGTVERVHHDMRHLVLKGADWYDYTTDEWEFVGAAFVSHADWWRLVEPSLWFEHARLDEIEPSPYNQRVFNPEENAEYIHDVHEDGWTGSFPTVRGVEEGYECISGNKRLWAASMAGLTTHPVIVRDIGDWAAATIFAFDHFPLPHHGESHDRYDDEQVIDAALEMHGLIGDEVHEIWPVGWNLQRLGVAPDQVHLKEFELEEVGDD